MVWIVKHCRICLSNRPGLSRSPLEPIVVNNVFERVQLDLIGMHMEKDHIFEWILHIKHYFSKYSYARALTGKGARLVAKELEHWIQLMGPPRIIQCDNSREFKGAVLHTSRKKYFSSHASRVTQRTGRKLMIQAPTRLPLGSGRTRRTQWHSGRTRRTT